MPIILEDSTIIRFDVALENPLREQLTETGVLREEVRRRLGWMGSYNTTDRKSINYCEGGAPAQILADNGYKRGFIKVELVFYPKETVETTTEPKVAATNESTLIRPRLQPQPQQTT